MFSKRILIILYTFLLVQAQFFSPAIADTCKNFYRAVTELEKVTVPFDEKTDLGIYFDYKCKFKSNFGSRK